MTTAPDRLDVPDDWRTTDPDAAALWDRLAPVDLDRYPDDVPADSPAGQTCRLAAAGATIAECVRLDCILTITLEVAAEADEADERTRRRDATYALIARAMAHRFAASMARDLHEIGVETPGITAADIAAVLNAPRPRCGTPTRTGRPCSRETIAPGVGCWQHEPDVDELGDDDHRQADEVAAG